MKEQHVLELCASDYMNLTDGVMRHLQPSQRSTLMTAHNLNVHDITHQSRLSHSGHRCAGGRPATSYCHYTGKEICAWRYTTSQNAPRA